MNKEGFMSCLEGLLADIPEAERKEAIQYYNDYFEDAGWENEESVIRSLGSPAKIAENIKAELKGEEIPFRAKAGDHAVTAYGQIIPAGSVQTDTKAGAQGADGISPFAREVQSAGSAFQQPYQPGAAELSYDYTDTADRNQRSENKLGKMPVWALLLIIFLAIIVLPGAAGILMGVLGILFGIIATWFGLILCGGALSVGLLAGAIGLVVISGLCLATSPAVFAVVLGVGLLCAGGGLISMAVTTWMTGRATPALIKWIWRGLCWIGRGIKKLWKRFF